MKTESLKLKRKEDNIVGVNEDPDGLGKSDAGAKFDGGKLRYDLPPPEIAEELVRVMSYGANKYSANGWKDVVPFNDRYYAALIRHLQEWRKGEILDKESGMRHLSHALTNMAFLLWKQIQDEVKDES